MWWCGYCRFVAPYRRREAEYVINGQSVCEDHVDMAGVGFHMSLLNLQDEQRKTRGDTHEQRP